MNKSISRSLAIASLTLLSLSSIVAADNPFLGYWELTVPGNHAGWLGVEDNGAGRLKASMMYSAGSVEPLASAKVEDGKLVLTRNHVIQTKNAAGLQGRKTIVETITATTDGNKIHLSSVKPRENGIEQDKFEFSGKRTPPMPPAPDISKVKFGPPTPLFNGRDLTGWRLLDPNSFNGWSVKDGLLVNTVVKDDKHRNYGNLRTVAEFEDFNLQLQVRANKGENSGVYLRGIYEIQVADTYGKAVDSHNMGAVYSRITPTVSAEKPPGEWQTMDITLVDRHVTVILNGKKIIDNQPVLGCTGGALWSDVSRPGPIYLQGDHTGAAYKDLLLRPVIK